MNPPSEEDDWICDPHQGCVQVRQVVQMRSSRDPEGPVLTFNRDRWEEFVAGVRLGEFDLRS